MGILSTIEKRMATGATGAADDRWYYPGGFFYGGIGSATKSGSKVSELNAMRLAIVWCCVKILSEDSASLPLHLYRRLDNGGKERATEHPHYSLLHDSPNPEMTAFTFREAIKAHILTWGNGYAEKVYGKGLIGRNVVESLWPIPPHRVTVKRNKGEIKNIPVRQIYYHISMSSTDLPDVILPREKIFHVPGLSYNGLVGYSVIGAAKEAVGLGMSLEEFGALYFGNGIHPSFVVSHPGQLKDPKNLRDAINEVHQGLGKSHKVLLLEEAMKVEKLGIPNDEAQFLESRKYTNIDIGTRIYRLPPQMYGEFDKASTYASAEQFSLDYVVKTLRPWLVRLEQNYNMQLLSVDERKQYFYEHLIDGLMRGDAAARADFYTKLFQVGGITPNQICEIENWNPIGPEGNRRFVPLNMIPLEDAGKTPDSASKAQNNRSTYRIRLQNAYRNMFADAAERVIRKEVKRLRWISEKPVERGNYEDFYREFSEYIQKQMLPAFLSYAEAITGMESELNGLEYDNFKAEMSRFIANYAAEYAENHIELSRNMLKKAMNNGGVASKLDEWETERGSEIASEQTLKLANSIIEQFKMLTGAKGL